MHSHEGPWERGDVDVWVLALGCTSVTNRFSRETLRQALKRRGYSWKKANKLLNKADSTSGSAFLEQLKPLLEKATRQERLLVYIDEAHIHQDTDIGYGWSDKGRRFWVNSDSPGLSATISFHDVYYFNDGQVRI